jgi:hypothetical protein
VDAERFEVAAGDGRKLEAIAVGETGSTVVISHHGTPGSAHEFWPAHVEEALGRDLRLVAYSRPATRAPIVTTGATSPTAPPTRARSPTRSAPSGSSPSAARAAARTRSAAPRSRRSG